MENNNLENAGSNSTANPQSNNTSVNTNIASPQNFSGTSSINNSSSANAIPLEPTQVTIDSTQSSRATSHHINLVPFIPLGLLLIVAIVVITYIQKGSKKALVKT